MYRRSRRALRSLSVESAFGAPAPTWEGHAAEQPMHPPAAEPSAAQLAHEPEHPYVDAPLAAFTPWAAASDPEPVHERVAEAPVAPPEVEGFEWRHAGASGGDNDRTVAEHLRARGRSIGSKKQLSSLARRARIRTTSYPLRPTRGSISSRVTFLHPGSAAASIPLFRSPSRRLPPRMTSTSRSSSAMKSPRRTASRNTERLSRRGA